MDDNTRAALDSETPVNPYSLLDALNAAAARSSTLWLLFLALIAYLALAVASVTHRDLLLDAGLVLPILQTRIDLARFFTVAPAVLALVHVMLVVQFVLLARKALEFHNAVRLLESTDLRSHSLRLEVDGFFFVQALAGPERSRVLGALLHLIGWLTLLVLPLLLLLYMQVAFLPFHDAAVTAAQRVVVLADIVLVLLAGVFLTRAETTFLGALLRMGLYNPGGVVFGLAAVGGAAFVSLFLATIPGAPGGDRVLGIFPRNLEVADAGLVPGSLLGTRSISLRGRDLRFARLDRADLRQADLTGASLDGASLAGADLRGARLGCAEVAPAQQGETGPKGGCTTARGAQLGAARLSGARLAGADLRGARFDDATLEAADLSQSNLAGATFERARLVRARLAGAGLQGTSFLAASLQGASLAGARLEMADLTGAGLQGASLAAARLAGATLREADLEGAVLQQARLFGADLRGARLKAADLAGAAVWQTVPPAGDAVQLADIANIAVQAPGKDDLAALKAAIADVESLPIGERGAGLGGLVKELGGDSAWGSSADAQAWSGLSRASEAAMAEGFKMRLTEHLGRMACRARFADGAVAEGVVRRALGPAFKGDAGVLNDRLKAADCAPARLVPHASLLELAAAAAEAKGP
jgi:uncharacterized protein YjbI with pentapeptide repeats